MRTEAEVKAKLDQLKADKIHATNNKLIWSNSDKAKEIIALEWVIGLKDDL